MKIIRLSHYLDESTPTYGNRSRLTCEKITDMCCGDVANNTVLNSTVHIGTHVDMPFHFYKDGQTIIDFSVDFWHFENPVYLDLSHTTEQIIRDTFIMAADELDSAADIILVKTGMEKLRAEEQFMLDNRGFSPELADFIREKFPYVRAIGFDSISVSSFQSRILGREAHKAFLNPENPILLIEDMRLQELEQPIKLNKVIVAPLLLRDSDGLPCNIMGYAS